jgi:hypothetical protein
MTRGEIRTLFNTKINARCYSPTMSHRKEKMREEIIKNKKQTNKQPEGI